MKTELLAPAGDIEAGYAAFYYGADAVYLGLNRFSARAEAVNFTRDELDALTAYAHSLNKKVYVALNTLVQEAELPAVLTALQECADCCVDAVIVQDMGIARIVRQHFPSLQLHASTQMAIHNLEGALTLKKWGFSRVVLARELTLREIEAIRDASGLEVEVFIHGALCYSYSGLCQFSSLETTRSANRGKCVYACRNVFRTQDGTSRLFSMKDLALETDVLKLKGCSLKIEGRKKNALYVAAVTHYYRTILDTGKNKIALSDNLKQIFARPWTKLHFNGKNKDTRAPDFAGHRGLIIGQAEKIANHTLTFRPTRAIARYDGIQIDVPGADKPFGFSLEHLKINGRPAFTCPAGQRVDIPLPSHHPFIEKGATVYLASSTAVKGAYPYQKPKPGAFKNRQSVDIDVFITADSVTVCSGETAETVSGAFMPAHTPDKTTASVRAAFDKNKDTPFCIGAFHVHNPDGLFVPAAVLNELRRRFYNTLPVQTTSCPTLTAPLLRLNESPNTFFIVKTDQPACLKKLPFDKIGEFLIEITPALTPKALSFLPTDKIRLALPVIFRKSAWLRDKINLLVQCGLNRFEISNFGGLALLPKNADISYDSFLPVLNTQSFQAALEQGASRITFSVEDTADNIRTLATADARTALIVYQDTPLFLSANCVRPHDCTTCDRQEKIESISDKTGSFWLISKPCQTVVTDKRPFSLAADYKTVPAGAYRLDFCLKPYTADQVYDIWQKIQNTQPIPNTFSGNFHKKFA